jgi:hypothetical protein
MSIGGGRIANTYVKAFAGEISPHFHLRLKVSVAEVMFTEKNPGTCPGVHSLQTRKFLNGKPFFFLFIA